MPSDRYAGPKFDHANYKLMRVMAWIFIPLAVVGAILPLWMNHRYHQSMAPSPLVALLPIFIIGLQPHWQVAPEGLVDLRKWKKKQLIAPYDQIETVRAIKNKGKTGRIFEVVTPAKTYKVDVLKGDEFVAAIEPYLGRDKIVT